MKLKNLPECYNMSGGAMIEHMARQGNVEAIPSPHILLGQRTCNFSFSGIKAYFTKLIVTEEQKQGEDKLFKH